MRIGRGLPSLRARCWRHLRRHTDHGHHPTSQAENVVPRRSISLDAGQDDVRAELDRALAEIEELRAARRRLVLAADADRVAIECDLHDGVHQRLVSLAIGLQLATRTAATDPAATATVIDDMRGEVQQALEEASLLAQRIYPETVTLASVGALLRAAAVSAAVPASVDVAGEPSCPPEVGMTLYLCWLDVLAMPGGEARVTIAVRGDESGITFDVGGAALTGAKLERVRDRVEALGGRLTIAAESDRGPRVSGSLPLSR